MARTAGPSEGSYFTDITTGQDLWTAAFLNERFPAPVTPLGWSLIRDPFERLALREPLAYLGHPSAQELRVTRLWHGHPYVAVEAFASLYKLLPDWLLPEDAARYFPDGRTDLRRRARYPGSWLEPRLWRAAAGTLWRERGNWWPWHNDRGWARLRRSLDGEAEAVAAELPRATDPAELLATTARLSDATAKLLAAHRWSLTHADLWYSALRRLGRTWLGQGWQDRVVHLVRGAERVSVALDAELHSLAALAHQSPRAREALAASTCLEELRPRLVEDQVGQQLVDGIAYFMKTYGHRSFSLDIYQPSFAVAPQQVFSLILALSGEPARSAPTAVGGNSIRLKRWQRPLFQLVLGLARRYLALREEQRFCWQSVLALQRATFQRLGEEMARNSALHAADDIYFLTTDEVARLARTGDGIGRQLAEARHREYATLVAEQRADPATAYPPFLRGDVPLGATIGPTQDTMRGAPVSAGIAVGPVRVVRQAGELHSVRGGEVLVAPAVDPAWTPVFARIAALVTEAGGQLSHAAVVAREYGLPAVLGVPRATHNFHTGDMVRVDGSAGTVTRVRAAGEPGDADLMVGGEGAKSA